MRKISILIADDHLLVRETWSMFLNADPRFSIIGSCESGEQAVILTRKLAPDVTLMDINLKGLNGFEATRQIMKFCPGASVLGVSMHAQPCYAKKMIKMGALGFVTKNSSFEEMFRAIIEVDKKNQYICKETRDLKEASQPDDNPNSSGLNDLSIREMEIIDYLKLGHSSREIADVLHLSAKTVEAHRYNILKKLNVKNTATLVNRFNYI